MAARFHHTATLLNSGKVLVVGGGNNGNTISSCEVYDPETGTWGAVASMATARTRHTATLLTSGTLSGKVLVTGGVNGYYFIPTCEIYDPETSTWSAAGDLATGRSGHTATLLNNGKVLVVGGFNGSIYLASCELYDPETNSWSTAGSLATARYGHTATLLPNGKVLVAGGFNGSTYFASCQLYDPETNSWSTAASLAAARYYHTATLLTSGTHAGKILVTGGYNGSAYLATCQLYDPETNSWSAAGSLAAARSGHSATLLTSGKVLVVGGYTSVASYELYDPATNTWSAAGVTASVRQYHTATLLNNGKVLVTGGYNGFSDFAGYSLSICEVYDPEINSWRLVSSITGARQNHTATLLTTGPNIGKVLVTGGNTGTDGGVSGGNGISNVYAYDLYSLFDHRTVTLGAWISDGGNIAYFSGTPGTVTLTSNISLVGLTSEIDGFIVNTSGDNTLNLSANFRANVKTGNFTLNAPISGSYDLIKSGSGNLVLSSNNTLTGAVKVQSGNLVFNSTASLSNILGLEVSGGSLYSYANLSRDVSLTSGTLSGNSTINSNVTVASSLSNIIRADSGNLTLANLAMSGQATFIASPGLKIITSNLTNNLSSTTSRFIDIRTSGSFSSGYSEVISAENSSAELSDFNLNLSGLSTNRVVILQGDGKTVGIVIKDT
jgi:autotransporter-associated beta strand protein